MPNCFLERKLHWSRWITLLFVAIHSFPVGAKTGVDISVESGRSRFFGDLSNSASAPTHSLSTLVSQYQEHTQFGIGIHILGVNTRHTGEDFPFEQNSQLKLMAFFFTPTVCSRGDIYFCAALGNGTVNVNSRNFRQDYGTWTYRTTIAFKIHSSMSVSLSSKYSGRVEQQIRDKKSSFSFLSFLTGITYVVQSGTK